MWKRAVCVVFSVAALLVACFETEPAPDVLAVNPDTLEERLFESASVVPSGWIICEDGDCSSAVDELCEEEACGPALGMPVMTCEDGSLGGNTGRCLRLDDGQCGWEIRQCPGEEPEQCDADACGPALGMPTILCEDGSVGGNTGRCLPHEDGSCGWEIRQCPDDGPDRCDEEACGPQLGMPTILCEDGSLGGNTGRCLPLDDGGCGWEIRECPEIEECTDEQCGPMPGMPAYLCEDGSLGGNTGRCLRDDEGQCGWEIRECEEPHDELCPDAECGPAPGMPAWECEDGSIGGNTGRCLREDEGCSWEIRQCPPPSECRPEDCAGPQPGCPALLCDDGSVAGCQAACVAGPDGCQWEVEVSECPEPPPACTAEDCDGPPPAFGCPARLCDDGSTGGCFADCVATDEGSCDWAVLYRECPGDPPAGS